MARPYTPVRVSKFGSFIDDVPVEIDEEAASTLANLYKVRNKLVRRKGTAPLGAALSPDADLNGLQWAKIYDREFLAGEHNGDIGDWLSLSPGQVLKGGAGVLSGNDANAAWINQQLFIGDGYSENQFISQADGLAVNFLSASSQKLSIATNSTLELTTGSFTLAFSVYFNTVGTQPVMLSKSAAGVNTTEYEIGLDAFNAFIFTVGNAGGLGPTSITRGAAVTGQWYWVVAWYDATAGTMSLSLNNSAATTGSGVNPLIGAGVNDFALGARSNSSHYLNGRLDNIRGWNRVLTSGERTALYNSGIPLAAWQIAGTTMATGLKGAWDGEEASGTRGDSSPSGNDLAATNAPGTAAGVGDKQLIVQQAMVGPPATACTAAADGAGTGTGNYTFVYAFLAANGQLSETSPVSNQVTLAGQRADLTGVTVSSEPGVTARYIFATGGTRTDYVLVSILANNTATTVTVNLDGIISPFSPLQTGNTRFPPCRYLVENQSRMIGAWCATAEGDKSTVYISNQLQPWYSPAAPDLTISANGTRAQLQGPAAGEIAGLCAHGDLTAVFTGGAGFLLIGTEAADFRLQRFSEHGCSAHRTIQSTRHLLIWLGNDGIWVWDGAQVSRISDPVRETIAAMSATDFAKAHGFVWYDRYYLCWPGHCLWYDLLTHTWGTNTAWDWRVSTVTTYTSSAQQRIYAGKTSHSRVWQLETGTDDNGTPITATWTSRDWDCGMPAHEKRVHLVECKWKKATGTATVTLYNGSGNLIQTFTQDLSSVDFTDSTIVRMLQSAVEQARDEHFRLSVSYAGSAADYELLSAGVQFMLAK